MKPQTTAFLALLIALGALTSVWMRPTTTAPQQTETVSSSEPVFDRIEKTGVLRCGYIVYSPYIMRDPNTGALSGIFYDLTNKVAEKANWKVEWTTEATYATLPEDMRQRKYDAFCGGLALLVSYGKVMDYSAPIFFSALGAYVRSDDHRFDADLNLLNDPQYKIATIDGEMSQIIQQTKFPKASVFGMPDITDIGQLAMNVASGKADASFMEIVVANEFLLNNPGKIRNLIPERPIHLYENLWGFPLNERRLKNVFDIATREMVDTGYVDEVLKKYEKIPNSFYRAADPFKMEPVR